MILSDKTIVELCSGETADKQMIYPFQSLQRRERHGRKEISSGLSSFGYDVILDHDVKIFSNMRGGMIDPKNINTMHFVKGEIITEPDGSRYFILPPNSYALGHTFETFDIPRDVMVVAVGKSTYARAGIIINVTPIEAGFRGQVVIEIANGTSLPAKVYIAEGIAQFLFFRGDKACEISYDDRGGKYQDQTGITHARV